MNTSEREQLSQFLQQLTQAQAGPKDTEAQGLIDRAMGQQIDAAYLLVQRALLQDAALKIAQDRIAALQEEVNLSKPAARGPGSFLDANAWGRAPAQASAGSAGSAGPAYGTAQAGAPGPAAYYPPVAAPMAAAPSPGFQAPSFLTSMATTAAGVAAGAFLFQGIGHLMGGHQNTGASAFGLGGPQSLDSSNAAPQTEIINNYFDKPQADGGGASDATSTSDRFLDGPSGNDGNGANDSFDSAALDLDTSSDDWT